MKRAYPDIAVFFLVLLALVIAGFTPRVPDTPFFGYFGQVARFGHVPLVIHVHALVALAWFSLLVTQACLIRFNRVKAHRLLGKASVGVVALLLWTAIQVMKHFYAHGILQMPRETVLSMLAQSFSALTLFVVFYAVALWRRRYIHQHVAFMVAASLAVATPGLARLGLYAVGGLPGILLVVAGIYATLVGFLLFAKLRYQQPVLRSPYLMIMGLFFMGNAMDFVGSQSAAWLWLADKIVSVW